MRHLGHNHQSENREESAHKGLMDINASETPQMPHKWFKGLMEKPVTERATKRRKGHNVKKEIEAELGKENK